MDVEGSETHVYTADVFACLTYLMPSAALCRSKLVIKSVSDFVFKNEV